MSRYILTWGLQNIYDHIIIVTCNLSKQLHFNGLYYISLEYFLVSPAVIDVHGLLRLLRGSLSSAPLRSPTLTKANLQTLASDGFYLLNIETILLLTFMLHCFVFSLYITRDLLAFKLCRAREKSCRGLLGYLTLSWLLKLCPASRGQCLHVSRTLMLLATTCNFITQYLS